MEWLTQNWTCLLLLVGGILFMRLGGMGCGFGGRRAHAAHEPSRPGAVEAMPADAGYPIEGMMSH